MKKFTRLLSLLFFLQIVWSSSIYGQVYSNDFTSGIDLPSPGPGNLFSTVWASSNPMTNPSGELLSKGFSTGSGTLTLTIKVKCGYELDISSIALKHRRDISGPQNMNLIVGGTTVQSGIAVTVSGPPSLTPLGSPYNTSGIPAAQDIVGQVLITLDLVNASNTGEYYLDDFIINGTITSRVQTLTATIPSATVCEGSPANFTGTFTATGVTGPNPTINAVTPQYQWEKNAANASGTSTNLNYAIASTVSPGDNGAYRLGVRFTGCAAGTPTEFYTTPAINLVVNKVTAAITPTSASVCVGSTTTLNGAFTVVATANPVPTVVWSSSDMTKATVSSGVVSGVAAGTSIISYTVTDNNGCSSSSSVTVTVNPLPTPSVSGTASICAGSTSQLTGTLGFVSPATSATAVWSTSVSSVATVSNTGLVSGVSAGTSVISYTVTDNLGCIATSSVTVTVKAVPVPTITGVTPVCVGSIMAPTYTPGFIAPAVSATAVWTSSATGVATVSNTSGVVTGVSSGTSIITYTVTDNLGCSSSTTTTVTVNPLPTISFTNNGVPAGQVCIGNTITINGNATGTGLIHSWSVTGSSVTPTSGTGSTITLTGTSAGTVTVVYTVTSGASCSTSSSMVVTVNGLPANPTITGSLSICEGSTTVLTGSTPSGGSGTGYFANFTGSGPANVTFTPGFSMGVYTATVESLLPPVSPSSTYLVGYSISDSKSCINAMAATATVTVFAKPSAASITAGNQTLCNTSTFTVTGNTPSVGSGTWTVTGGTVTSSTSATTTITGVTAGTTATAVWTITNGTCGATSSNVASVTLTNNVMPTISASASGPNCNNGTFTLTSSASVGTGVWTTTSGTVTNTTSTSTTVTGVPAGITATLTWTVTNGSCTTSTTTTVTNNAPPSAAVITTTPQKQCGAGVFVVTATAPTVGTGTWTVTGGGVAQSPSSATTFVTGVLPGTVSTATWTVTSGPGCPSTSSSVTLTNYQAPTGVYAGADESHCENPVFSLIGFHNPLSGVTDLHYSWTTTAGTVTTPTASNTTLTAVPSGVAAFATFTVTNGVCAASSDQVEKENYQQHTVTVGSNVTVCNQLTNFTVSSTVVPAVPTTGTYSYAWTVTAGGSFVGASTGSSVTVTVSPGSSAMVAVTVTNGNITGACMAFASKVITNNAPVTASIPAGNQTLCNTSSFSVVSNNPSPGTGVWTVTGGTPSSTNSSSITVTGVAAGTTATATWTVTNGLCTASTSVTLTNVGPVAAMITTPSPLVGCNQATNFTINAAPFAYGTGVWTTFNASISGPNTGTSVSVSVVPGTSASATWTVTNGVCGSSSSTITIDNRPALTATIVPNPITPTEMCPGTSINLQATPNGGPGRVYALQSFVGGAGSGTNFIVNFNPDPNANPNRLATVNGINAQPIVTLTYTIIDNAGCTFSTQFVTKVNPPISVTVPATDVCVNASKVVTPVITGGSGTYSTYSWSVVGPNASGGGTSATFVASGLTAGTANVVYSVTDNQTCPASGTAVGVITVRPLPTIMVTSQINVSCFGGSNGAVTVTSPSTNVYTISPSAGIVQSPPGTFTGLSAGNHNLSAISSFGCAGAINVVMNQPTLLIASVAVTTPVSCNGGNASLTITPSGGTSGYSVSGGTFTPSVTAGTYTYTVTDANGCTASTSITVGQPTLLVATASVTTPISCNGGTATVTVGASGGTTAYTGTGAFSGQAAGPHTYTVTDANGCTASVTITIAQPTQVTASIASSTNVSCNGLSNGSATVTAGGGTPGFTYAWSTSPVQTTATATGLIAGSYTVIVTDANSCSTSTSVTITQPSVLLAGASQNTPPSRNGYGISCFGGNDGSATAAAFGGTPGYTYLWSNGETTAVATMLSAGTATVTVTDANGCPTSASVTMTQPPTAVSFSSATFTSPNCAVGQGVSNNGTITVSATGGISTYTYAITPTATQGSPGAFTGISASTTPYIVTVTDANGCTATTSIIVTPLATVAVTPTAVPNPICSGTATTLSASATGGTITGYSWSVTASTGNTATAVPATSTASSFVSTISQGANTPGISTLTYTVVATNSNSCSASSTVNVVVNPLPYLTGVGSPDPTCRDAGAFGFVYLTNPNSANQINFVADNNGILLSPPASNVAITASPVRVNLVPSLPIGNSTLTYTVTNTTTGCVSPTSTYIVRVNVLPTVTALSISGANELCDGGPTKTLDVTTNGANFGQVGAFPRTVRIKKTANSVVSFFDIVVPNPGSGSVASSNIAITDAGTYEVIGITDGATCAGTISGIPGGPIRTLSDGRFTVTAPATNTTQVVYDGCSAVLTVAAAFNSTPSVGTLAYQWEVDPGTGYIAVNGETSTTLTLTGINSTFNGLKYRCRVTSSGSSCGTVMKFSNEITLSVATLAAAAGPDQTAPGATFTLAATLPAGTTGAWSVVSTNTTVTFASSTNPVTTVTLANPNTTATLRWTVTAPGGCSTFDDVVISRVNIRLDAKVFLEGPLSGSSMNTNIRSILPTTSPYGTGESSSVILSNPVTEWIKVELRNAVTPATVVDSRSGLLLSNGKIVDMDGVSPLTFNNAAAGTYHIAVIHRNHIDFRTNTALSFTAGTSTMVDFTIAAPNVFNTALKLIGGTTSAMYAGDANGDNRINLSDYLLWFSKNNTASYPYSILSTSAANADFNLNPGVNLSDYLKWFTNNNVNKSPNP